MSAQLPDRREGSDLYAEEICRVITASGSFRLIVCRDGIQWIIQRSTRASGGPRRASWRAVAYLTTREGLERLWVTQTGLFPPAAIFALPPRIAKRQQTTR